jgi:type II secretory pathway pseudopilin PulG
VRFIKRAVVVLIIASLAATGSVQAQAKADKYKEARDLIRRARSLLGDFVNENPKSEDAHFARLQLAALENIFKTDVPVVPVTLNDAVTWRVVRVENRDADTKVTLEIENPDESNEQQFAHFNAYPLVLIANKKVYAMKKGEVRLPAGAQIHYDYWRLQPTSVITLDLHFDALDEGVVEGMIKYAADDRREKAARFSLMNVNQNPRQE